MKETIGWIGIGSMGHRMSQHLARPAIRWWWPTPSAPSAHPPAPPSPRATRRWPRRPTSSSSRFPTARCRQAVAREIAAAKTAPRQDRDRHLHHRHQGGRGRRRHARAGRHRVRRCARVWRHGGRRQGHDRHHGGLPRRRLRALQAADRADGQAVPCRPQARAGTGGQAAQQLPLGHGACRHVGGHRLRHQAGHRDEDHPRHRQRLVGPQLRDRGQVPRTASCMDATTRASRPSFSSRTSASISRTHALPASTTRSPLSWSTFGSAWRGRCRAPISRRCTPTLRRAVRRKDAPDDAWRGRSALLPQACHRQAAIFC